ncbi:uncharacterized protein LOC121235452 [Juglans microcarpa x Juglans regia]|uniref:uncharacterized protein LOC121235452 n=1 Tax=Juglans microcarpa x Juglans regia TaxID=2249226 RepID=UPI001B7DA96E|nr:uncharacterized protein LOC121235452 [Juglans microcarpa x Juglans regia]
MQKKGFEETVQQLSNTLQQFMQGQATINNQNSQAINDIRSTLTKMTTAWCSQEKGKLPAQPQHNPQSQPPQGAVESSNVRQVKAVTTLRNGRVVNIPAQGSDKAGKISCPVPAPFPQRLVPLHKDKHQSEILEIFKHVRINIPLLDAIQQIHAYAMFLKDLCTVKRKLNVQKKAFLTQQVSAILQSNTPPKYKDPGSPTIACVIGSSKIGQALLDLGSSVNLLPYNVYEQLGLEELKPTPIILQLADRSIKMPRGVVEDVLVQVDKFFYSVDFIVLDVHLTHKSSFQAPVILGRPFLATSNALINYKSGVLKLSFGNMTLELNIFNICRQPQDLEDVQEVNLLESILEEETYLAYQPTNLLFELENFCELLTDDTPINVSHVFNAENKLETKWRPKIEQLPPLTVSLKPSANEIPTLELKPLPNDLKYAFLGPDSTFPVVISAQLSHDQEGKLMEILKQHKGAIGWTIADIKALKYLLSKKDAKPRLIRWILLLQEFDLIIKDKKGAENVVTDHLSRLTFAEKDHTIPILDSFPDEQLMSVENLPWFVDIVNFLVTGQTPPHWSAQDIRKFKHEISELDELRRDAYDNSKLSKERMKVLHDKHIQRKNFKPNEQVLLYNSRLHLFPGKLRSRRSGPYVVKAVFPYGAVEITNPQNGNTFKVNGQRLKYFLAKLSHEDTSIPLEDPTYSHGP